MTITKAMVEAYEAAHKADWFDPSQFEKTALWAKAWEAAAWQERELCLAAYDAIEPTISDRYRVEKRSGGGFWPYCVKAGSGTMELFVGHKTKCQEVAQALQTACHDGAFMVADEIRRGS